MNLNDQLLQAARDGNLDFLRQHPRESWEGCRCLLPFARHDGCLIIASCDRGHVAVTEYLLSLGEISVVFLQRALFLTKTSNTCELLFQALISQKLNPCSLRNFRGCTLLQWACMCRRSEVVRFILESPEWQTCGLDVNHLETESSLHSSMDLVLFCSSSDRFDTLTEAEKEARRECFRLLIDRGAIANTGIEIPLWGQTIIQMRNETRTLALLMLSLKRAWSKKIGPWNGRDVLGIVARHVWTMRMTF